MTTRTMQSRDVETFEEQLATLLEKLEELENRRSECLQDLTQNASEQEQEFGTKPKQYWEKVTRYEVFEERLDEAITHVKHAYDIFCDDLPRVLP